MIKKVVITLLLLLVIGGGGGAYLLLAPNFAPARGTTYVYIRPDDTFDGLCRQLTDSAGCRQVETFRLAARALRYADRRMPTGRYAVRPGMNNLDLLLDLRRGNQSPVRITFRNVRLKHDLSERLAATGATCSTAGSCPTRAAWSRRRAMASRSTPWGTRRWPSPSSTGSSPTGRPVPRVRRAGLRR